MITDAELAKLVELSHSQQATVALLRRLVFSTVDAAAHVYFKNKYAVKCLQTSLAIEALLGSFGISSRLFCGAVRYPESFAMTQISGREIPAAVQWGSFDDHGGHVWLITQFGEVVDLSISQAFTDKRHGIRPPPQVPALWWKDDMFPSHLYYRIQGTPKVDASIRAEIDEFISRVNEEFARLKSYSRLNKLKFGPMIENRNSFDQLRAHGSAWVKVFDIFSATKQAPPQSYLDAPGKDMNGPP